MTLNNLAMVLVPLGLYSDAKRCYEQALMLTKQHGGEALLNARIHNNLGMLLRTQDDL